jgi:hypothetical protein
MEPVHIFPAYRFAECSIVDVVVGFRTPRTEDQIEALLVSSVISAYFLKCCFGGPGAMYQGEELQPEVGGSHPANATESVPRRFYYERHF